MRKTAWFTAYRNVVPAKYEAWFEDLAAQGWHPQSIRHISSIRMVLVKAAPVKYKYALELLGRMTKDRKAMYADFGWEYVGRMSSIFVWRKAYTDVKPQMFSDAISAKKRSKRFVVAISASFGLFTLGFLVNIVLAGFKLFGHLQHQWLDIVLMLVVYGASAVYLYTVIRKIAKNKDAV